VRYLITGGAGFIGSHVVAALLDRGDEVVGLDDFSTGKERNIEALLDRGGFRMVEGSVLDRDLVDDAVSDCDVVVHLAAAIGVKLINDRPLESMRTNIHGTENVLDAAAREGRKVLFASTSEVYGRTLEVMHERTDRVLGPTSVSRWSYSAAKAIGEHIAHAYRRDDQLPVIIARFFNTVGPRQTGAYGGVIPRLVGQALRGESLTLYGDGTQTRCFCDVDDVIRAVLGLLDDDRAEGATFNIGSEHEVSMNDLAETILEVSGSASDIVHVQFADVFGEDFEDVPRRVPDTAKIRTLLGWEPRIDLRAIVKRTIDHAHEVGPDQLAG
jgi:UDP-glucose 4-epimerase